MFTYQLVFDIQIYKWNNTNSNIHFELQDNLIQC
jgi:hypothetical protein